MGAGTCRDRRTVLVSLEAPITPQPEPTVIF